MSDLQQQRFLLAAFSSLATVAELKDATSESQLMQRLTKRLPVQASDAAGRHQELKYFLMQANKLCLVDRVHGYASAIRVYLLVLAYLNKVACAHKLPQ